MSKAIAQNRWKIARNDLTVVDFSVGVTAATIGLARFRVGFGSECSLDESEGMNGVHEWSEMN
jgi:hypothetical protein